MEQLRRFRRGLFLDGDVTITAPSFPSWSGRARDVFWRGFRWPRRVRGGRRIYVPEPFAVYQPYQGFSQHTRLIWFESQSSAQAFVASAKALCRISIAYTVRPRVARALLLMHPSIGLNCFLPHVDTMMDDMNRATVRRRLALYGTLPEGAYRRIRPLGHRAVHDATRGLRAAKLWLRDVGWQYVDGRPIKKVFVTGGEQLSL